jgi:hypothetical protein
MLLAAMLELSGHEYFTQSNLFVQKWRGKMDNNKKLFEELLKADDINPAGASESERISFAKILDQQLETKQSKPTRRSDIWRVFMKSRITKFAVAAVLVIAAIIGINQFSNVGVAWGQVIEQLNNHEKYKCRQRIVKSDGSRQQIVRPDGSQVPAMNVYHLNLSQRRQEVEDGTMHIIDMRGADAITVELDPVQKKATVTKLIGFGPRKDPDIIEMVKQFEPISTEKLGTKKRNGKILYGFRHQPDKSNDYTIWVDADTKLPVEIEIKHIGRERTILLDEFEFDFDMDMSAFSTDVPEGYKIETITQDYRPVKPKEIAVEDIRNGLNHTAYAINKLPWMETINTIEAIDPLGSKAKVYMTGIKSNDGNIIIIVQGNYYDIQKMVWIPKQQLILTSSGGVKLYTHPNGSLYAQYFLESFANANPDFFDIKNLSEERFTRMIVMPDGTVMSLSANKLTSDKQQQELVESLVEIKAN